MGKKRQEDGNGEVWNVVGDRDREKSRDNKKEGEKRPLGSGF
jgi:hypothetical protein